MKQNYSPDNCQIVNDQERDQFCVQKKVEEDLVGYKYDKIQIPKFYKIEMYIELGMQTKPKPKIIEMLIPSFRNRN